MKVIIRLTIIAIIAALASAQVRADRRLGKSKSFAFRSDDSEPKAVGELGCRQECSDKRFTMVCKWEAEKKVKKSYKKSHSQSHSYSGSRSYKKKGKSHRRLGEEADLDFEDEVEDNAVASYGETTVDVGGGRRLKVSLSGVECILGVGKKDSDDSSEDYEEYKERLSFPNDAWELKIKAAEGDVFEYLDYYKFTRAVEFEGVEDPNNSADELTIKGKIEIELLCAGDDLIIDGSKISFSC